jgi:hypothetical protein
VRRERARKRDLLYLTEAYCRHDCTVGVGEFSGVERAYSQLQQRVTEWTTAFYCVILFSVEYIDQKTKIKM